MFAEFFASGSRGSYGGNLAALWNSGCRDCGGLFRALRACSISFEIVLENVFGGARLAGNFAEAQKEWLGEASAVDAEDADGLLFGGALKNDGVEIGDAASDLGAEAQRGVNFFDAFVELRGALEIEIGAGAFAVVFDRSAERVAIGVEELHEALDFCVVFLFGAPGKARRQAHFHFGIDAAGESGIATDFDLAAAHFEEVKSLLGKSERGFSGREWAVVSASRGRAGFVDGDAARDVAARIGVAQADFQDGGRTQAREFAIALREEMLGVLIVREDLFERGTGEAIANAAREFAKIEPFAGGIGGAEEALQAAQILRANQKRLGVFRARFDQADGGFGRQGGEKIFVAGRVEILAAVEFKHGDRI